MTTKVNFELVKNQDIPNKLRLLIESTVTNNFGMQDYYYQWLDNLLLFLETLGESSSFAHLAHKQLSVKEKPSDKLKGLWNEWNGHLSTTFELFIVCYYVNGKWVTDATDNDTKAHRWLAEHCGFLTTAEVRRVIQELKQIGSQESKEDFIKDYNKYLDKIGQGKFIGENPFEGCGIVPGFYHEKGYSHNPEDLEDYFNKLK